MINPAFVAIALSSLSVSGRSVELRLRNGNVIRVYSAYGRAGSVSLSVTTPDGRRTKRSIPMPNEMWPDTDDERLQPVAMLTRGTRAGETIVDLTLQEVSGVYGYRGLMSYRILTGAHGIVRFSGSILAEFSDFGSWTRISPSLIEFWDADLSEAPHEGPHHYWVKQIRRAARGMAVVRKLRSMRAYDRGWTQDGLRPSAIEADNDPLREFGGEWRWWGERKPTGVQRVPHRTGRAP